MIKRQDPPQILFLLGDQHGLAVAPMDGADLRDALGVEVSAGELMPVCVETDGAARSGLQG